MRCEYLALFLVVWISAAMLTPFMAYAQEQAENSRLLSIIEEIVVTAEKRESTLQDTPISLAAFTARDLEILGIQNIFDLQSKVPNLQMTPFPTSNQTLRLVIRGIGTNDVQITQDPSIGVYVDGVYIARATGLALDVAELERIEVLRGPQGTLYGRNATGGAINLITIPPDLSKFGAKQVFSVGNRNYWQSKTQLNVPLTDELGFKLAYLRSSKDGFMENDGPGKNFGDKSSEGARFDFRWVPTEDFMVDYAFDYSDLDAVNSTYQSLEPATAQPGQTPGESSFNLAAAAAASHSPRRERSLSTVAPLKESNYTSFGHGLTLTWALNAVTFKSITAYRGLEEDQYVDLGGGASADFRLDNGSMTTPARTVPGVGTMLTQRQFSEELQVLGEVGEDWEYLGGAYFFNESGHQRSMPLHGQIFLADFPFAGLAILRATASNIHIENKSWALYSRATWSPSFFEHNLHATLGARYTLDDRKTDRVEEVITSLEPAVGLPNLLCDPDPDVDDQNCFSIDANPSATFRNFSPSFTLAYDWAEDRNSYVKVVRGYKTGGFNTRAPSNAEFNQGFDEETVTSYEVGAKGKFFESRLRVNAAVFYNFYDDIQMNLLIPGTTTLTNVVNAGTAKIYGAELDITAVLTDGLLANLNYGFVAADYKKVEDQNTGANIQNEFIFPNAPKNTARLGLDYTFPPILSFGTLSGNLNLSWVDDRATTARKDAFEVGSFIEHYYLLDARLTLAGVDVREGSMQFALWGKNLTDVDYVASAVDGFPHSNRAVLWGEPRTFGLDMTYEF